MNNERIINGEDEDEDGGIDPVLAEKMEELRVKQLEINFQFAMNAIDEIHDNLCPGHIGTWQERVRQAIQASKLYLRMGVFD